MLATPAYEQTSSGRNPAQLGAALSAPLAYETRLNAHARYLFTASDCQ
jgi:hypothetical protein